MPYWHRHFLFVLFFVSSFFLLPFSIEQLLLDILACILFVWIGYKMLLLRTCCRFYIVFEIMFFLNESDRWVLEMLGKMGRYCVDTDASAAMLIE